MTPAGPPLAVLTRRLLDTPADFQLPGTLPPPLPGAPPEAELPPEIHVRAVLADVLDRRAVPVDAALLERLLPTGASRNQQALTLLIAWLLAEPALPLPAEPAGYTQLAVDLAALAPELPVERGLAEDERREELARLLLAALGLVPAGESPAQARDRYAAVSTLEAVRLAGMSRAREQRAREILVALARKAAEDAADKWSRE